MTATNDTRQRTLARELTACAAYWGNRAVLHMRNGFSEMAYETAYTACHCARLALAAGKPITELDRQEDGRR